MEPSLLEQHEHLVKKLQKARENLTIAEELLLANETEIIQAFKQNPLMSYIGLMAHESDISDFIGSNLSPERPSLGHDVPKHLLPTKTHTIDPVLINVIHEDPCEDLLYAYPCHAIEEIIADFEDHAHADSISLSQREKKIQDLVVEINPQELAYLAPENSERATLALLCLKVGIWDWDTVNGEVYCCPIWHLYMGYKENYANPLESLTASLDSSDTQLVENVLRTLGESENNSFSLHVSSRPKQGIVRRLVLNGLCVRNQSNEMLRILITATNSPI